MKRHLEWQVYDISLQQTAVGQILYTCLYVIVNSDKNKNLHEHSEACGCWIPSDSDRWAWHLKVKRLITRRLTMQLQLVVKHLQSKPWPQVSEFRGHSKVLQNVWATSGTLILVQIIAKLITISSQILSDPCFLQNACSFYQQNSRSSFYMHQILHCLLLQFRWVTSLLDAQRIRPIHPSFKLTFWEARFREIRLIGSRFTSTEYIFDWHFPKDSTINWLRD